MKKLMFAALLAALFAGGWGIPAAQAAGGPQTIPLDRNSRPIPVLKFGPFGTATMVITYDGNSSVSASNDQGSAAGSVFPSAGAVFNSGRIGTSIIRIYCNTDAHVAIETSRDRVPVATTRDTPIAAHLPAYVAIQASNDRFAAIQQSAAGTCWFTPLE